MDDRYEKGIKVMRQHLGPKADSYVEEIAEIAPLFARVNVESAFGDIYGGDSVLDIKTQELCTIAALTVQGFSGPQLKVHIEAALRNNVTVEEVVQVITQMINYGGYPAATNALMVAKSVFKEQDLL